MTRRVLVHVGTPKTGTSSLQDVLFRNRDRLLEHDVLYPADRFEAHFLEALDLMRLPWGGLEHEALGCWERLAAQVRAHHGTAIVSHEILARATTTQAAAALASFDEPGGEPAEVHLILSGRDLVRQVPAEWQENVKHRSSLTYERFLGQLRDPERASRIGSWFWGVQEIPDILDRWGAGLPPEQVHLITVPPPGGDPDLLWQRFSYAFGLDGLDLDLDTTRANPSMGVPETALLRRINASTNKLVPPVHYRPLVRELVAHQTLSPRRGSPRLAVPPDLHDWLHDLQVRWVTEVRDRGYDVVGDLDDLLSRPTVPAEDFADPDRPDEADVADAALATIGAMLVEHVRARDEHAAEAARAGEVERDLRRQLDEVRAALERSYLRPSYLRRERIVRGLERSRVGRVSMRLYRAARGRSSRSA